MVSVGVISAKQNRPDIGKASLISLLGTSLHLVAGMFGQPTHFKEIEMTTSQTYTCALCNQTFTKGWSDEEALAELEKEFPLMAIEHCAVVCDDCYTAPMTFDTHKAKVRKDMADLYRGIRKNSPLMARLLWKRERASAKMMLDHILYGGMNE